jgi:hypothetical protein
MITEKDQEFLEYWDSKRKSGRWVYSLKHGVLIFAWPVYLLTELFKYLTGRADYTFQLPVFLKGFLIWTLLGFIAFGSIMWWTQERQYHQIKKKEGK